MSNSKEVLLSIYENGIEKWVKYWNKNTDGKYVGEIENGFVKWVKLWIKNIFSTHLRSQVQAQIQLPA